MSYRQAFHQTGALWTVSLNTSLKLLHQKLILVCDISVATEIDSPKILVYTGWRGAD